MSLPGVQTPLSISRTVAALFDLGGIRMQLNVVDQQTLRKAMESPDDYADLIIRIRRYSELWGRFSEPVRRTVLERTEHQ